MEKKKISIVTIIIFLIVALILGVGLGYFIYEKIHKQINPAIDEKQEVMQNTKINGENILVNEKNTEITKDIQPIIVNEITSNTTVNTVKYDGSKSVTINGKNYTVAYVSEKIEHIEDNGLQQTELKLYLNDKKVKTLNLGYLIDVNHELGNKDYGIELYNFCEEYILILVKTKHNDGKYQAVNSAKFCIMNREGEYIDTLEWSDATQIWKDQKQLTYEINDDSIILYESTNNGATKIKYTVIQNVIKKEILKSYNENEISLSGK